MGLFLLSFIGHQLKEYYKETFYRSLLHTSLIILECGDSTLTIIVSSYKGVLAVFVPFEMHLQDYGVYKGL